MQIVNPPMPAKAIVEQQNADYWATQARNYVFNMNVSLRQGAAGMADYYRRHALSAQEYAYHSHGMALYWLGLAPFPTVL